MSRRKAAAPAAPPPKPDWRARLRGPAAMGALAGLVLVAAAAVPRLEEMTTPALDNPNRAATIQVRLTADQFSRPPTWHEVLAYYGLEDALLEPTRLANAGPDGACPAEPIGLPQDVLIALSPGDGRVCRGPRAR